MKKYLYLLMVAIFVALPFALTSCGGASKQNNMNEQEEVSETSTDIDEQAEENNRIEEERQAAEEKARREEQVQPKLTPAEVESKILSGESLTSSDYDVMLDYCEELNNTIRVDIESLQNDNLNEIEKTEMMNALHERFPYISHFMTKLGDNRERLSTEQQNRASMFAREYKRMYTEIKGSGI